MKFRLLRLIYCFMFAFLLRFAKASKDQEDALDRSCSSTRNAYTITRAHRRLRGHSIKTFSSPSLISCGLQCVRNPRCVSTNFKVGTSNKGGECELNDHGVSSPTDEEGLELVQGVVYTQYQIESLCSSGPCKNNATCVSRYEQNSYSCVCAAGYTGKSCEAPLECHQYSVLSEADRHRSYGRGSMSDDSLSPGWYRFQHSSYSKMLDTCISNHRCNTDVTGWLKGGHPTVTDGVVTRDACFQGFGNCCWKKVEIRVRDCNGFYVYELKPSHDGPFRYCSTN